MLSVLLQSDSGRWEGEAIVDSGADDCVFPASWASHLGLGLSGSTRIFTFGGAGSSSQVAYFFDLKATFENFVSYRLPVGFSAALDHVGFGLLGQNGFFERFRVTFDVASGFFHLEPK
jgi:hypothetical protein